MQVWYAIFTISLSALTGWFVIWLSLTILVKPYHQQNFLGLKIQGILPANQEKMANAIGKMVRTEIGSVNQLEHLLAGPEVFNKLKPEIELHIDLFLRERLKDSFPMLSMLIGDKTINQLKGAFLTELESIFPVIMKSYLLNLEKDFDIEQFVSKKIADLSIKQTTDSMVKLARIPIVKLQILGLLIGLIFGILQMLINYQLFYC